MESASLDAENDWAPVGSWDAGEILAQLFVEQVNVVTLKSIPGADPVGELGIGVRRVLDTLSAAGLTSVSSKFYDDARHELVHEKNRKDVIPHIVSWLTKHIT